MTYFSEDFVQFFKELAANNNKEWFDLNRKRYEQQVKDPFKNFVSDLIAEVKKIDKQIDIEAKDAIFRINRDIRFSKDKTPYKLHRSAVVSVGGKKDKTTPGLYIQLGPEDVRIYGGLYQLDRDELYDVREYIVNNGAQFKKIINASDFVSLYGGKLHGERNKIIPKEFKAAGENQPLIYNKSWYYFVKYEPDLCFSDKLMDIVLKAYKVGRPMQEYFIKALMR